MNKALLVMGIFCCILLWDLSDAGKPRSRTSGSSGRRTTKPPPMKVSTRRTTTTKSPRTTASVMRTTTTKSPRTTTQPILINGNNRQPPTIGSSSVPLGTSTNPCRRTGKHLRFGNDPEASAEFRFFYNSFMIRDKMIDYMVGSPGSANVANVFASLVNQANARGEYVIQWHRLTIPDIRTYAQALSQCETYVLAAVKEKIHERRSVYIPLIRNAIRELDNIIAFRASGMANCGRPVDGNHDSVMRAWVSIKSKLGRIRL